MKIAFVHTVNLAEESCHSRMSSKHIFLLNTTCPSPLNFNCSGIPLVLGKLPPLSTSSPISVPLLDHECTKSRVWVFFFRVWFAYSGCTKKIYRMLEDMFSLLRQKQNTHKCQKSRWNSGLNVKWKNKITNHCHFSPKDKVIWYIQKIDKYRI